MSQSTDAETDLFDGLELLYLSDDEGRGTVDMVCVKDQESHLKCTCFDIN